MQKNINTLEGTIYSKQTKTWPSKKAGEPDMEFHSFRLEFKIEDGGRTITSIEEFTTKMGLTTEAFEVGDDVIIYYFPFGKQLEKKDGSGTWWKHENKVIHMAFTDKQGGGRSHIGKITVDPSPTPGVKSTFKQTPIIPETDKIPKWEESDLPF